MNIPFVDLKSQYRSIKQEIDLAIQTILDSTEFVQGKTVRQFEEHFAELQEVQHAIACSSGTDALHLILWALGIGRGDEVITTPHTFIATVEAIALVGARPVFVDIDEQSYTIDPTLIEHAITERTRAIMPVHLYGQACDMDPIMEIAKRHRLSVVEDCCQSHLATYRGRKTGNFGIASAFSFYPGKNLGAFGEAGAVVTNDDELAVRLRRLRDHGQSKKYHHEELGHNYRMDGIQAAVLDVKAGHVAEWTEARRRIAREYGKRLKHLTEIGLPVEMEYGTHVYHLFVIRSSHRNELKDFLEEKGISTGLHYPIPLHLQKALEASSYREGSFQRTEKAAQEILSLPMYPELSEEQIDFVCNRIKEFCR